MTRLPRPSALRLLAAAALLLSAAACTTFDPDRARRDQTDSFTAELASRADALPDRPLTLDDCIAVAMTNNYAVRQAALDRELGRVGRNVAFSAFLPQVALSAGYNNRDYDNVQGMTTAGDMVVGPRRDSSAALTASLPIFMPSTWFLYAAARHGYAQAGIAEHYARQSIVLQTTAAFCDVLVQQDTVAALEQQLSAAREVASRLEGFAREGFVRSWEADQSAVQVLSRETELAQARRRLVVLRAELLHVMGLSPTAPLAVSDTLPPADAPSAPVEDLVLEALSVNPRLAIADREVVKKEHAVRQAFCAFLPTLSLSGTHAWGGQDFDLQAVGWSTGFQAAWSVFAGLTDVARWKAAKIDRQSAELARENLFLEVIVSVLSAQAAVEDARANVELCRRAYEALSAKYDDYAARAQEGIQPISDALDALAQRDIAQVTLVRARYAERLALANLSLAMGTTSVPGEELPAEPVVAPFQESQSQESQESQESQSPPSP
jgi:outer membrane protein TolC